MSTTETKYRRNGSSHQPGWTAWLNRAVQLVLLAAVVAGLWWAVPRIAAVLGGLQQEVAVSLVVGVLTVTGYLWRRNSEIQENRRNHIRDQKVPVYETFLRFWFKLLFEGAKGKGVPSKKVLHQFVVESVPGFVFWASDDVIRAWNELRNKMAQNSPGQKADPMQLFELEELMLTMRADLGQDNSKLRRGDLLALFINDIGTLMPDAEQKHSVR